MVTKGGTMNSRFPVLSVFSVVLRVLGWLVLAGGIISSLIQIADLMKCLPNNCSVNIPWLIQNVALLVMGAITVVIGEAIGVVFAIEGNTRRLVEIQEQHPAQVSVR